MITNTRRPAVAGTFYTDDPTRLQQQVDEYLSCAKPSHNVPKAIIAPHAGYMYSGPIAGSAYAAIVPLRNVVKRVVLLGPAHRVYVNGVAATTAHWFASPLGKIPVDHEVTKRLVHELDFVFYLDDAHAQEHSLEVQLPFLQTVLEQFTLVPFAVGHAQPAKIEQLLDRLWGGPETLIVISSDLSHYHDYRAAQELDRCTTGFIEQQDDTGLTGEHACGQIPISGLLRVSRRKGLAVETLDTRNSGDTAGPRDRVVGYGAYLLHPSAAVSLIAQSDRKRLTDLAMKSIEHGVEHGVPIPVDLNDWPAPLQKRRATFVTLKQQDKLRGCIGTLSANRPLVEDIADNAFAAAFRDPRFSKVTTTDLKDLRAHLSVLSAPEPIEFQSKQELIAQLRPGVDGLIVTEGEHRGTFLPSVWTNIPVPETFLKQLMRKAGLAADYWSDTVRIERYSAESW